MNTITRSAQPELAPGDLYAVLGVPTDATEDDIRQAYKQAAGEHHPDKGGDAEKFKEVKQAYETLIDPEKRQIYDASGLFEGEDMASATVARDIVRSMIATVLNDENTDLEHLDIVSAISSDIESDISKCHQGIAFIGKSLKRLNKHRCRAKRGIIRQVFDDKIAALEKARESLKEDIVIFELALKIAEACVYEYDEAPPPPTIHHSYVSGPGFWPSGGIS